MKLNPDIAFSKTPTEGAALKPATAPTLRPANGGTAEDWKTEQRPSTLRSSYCGGRVNSTPKSGFWSPITRTDHFLSRIAPHAVHSPCCKAPPVSISIFFRIVLVSAFLPWEQPASAQETYIWPVDASISQQYGERDSLLPGQWTRQEYPGGQNIHAGVDLPGENQTPIKATAYGTIHEIFGLAGSGSNAAETIPLWNDVNGDWLFGSGDTIEEPVVTGNGKRSNPLGISVVVKHSGGWFSHYGHRDSVRKDLYQRFKAGEIVSVNRGEQIALMGGSSGANRTAFAPHLHFEIKYNPQQSDLSNRFYGYTPGHPDLYGYEDPKSFIHPYANGQSIIPVVLANNGSEVRPIRNAPSLYYDQSKPTQVVAHFGAGQRLVASKRVQVDGTSWYFVHLASRNYHSLPDKEVNGPNGGWVSGEDVVLATDAVTFSVTGASPTLGVEVRDAAFTGPVLGRLYNGQLFVLVDPVPPNPSSDQWVRTFIAGVPQGRNNFEKAPGIGWVRPSALQIRYTGANLQCIADTGLPVKGGATVQWGSEVLGTTDDKGQFIIPSTLSGTKVLTIIKGALRFVQSFFVSTAEASTVQIQLESTAQPAVSTRFQIGDVVEVFGTGIGLRARLPESSSRTYRVMADGLVGTILQGPNLSGGYNRWKIQFNDEAGTVGWCAEGEPNSGEQYLRTMAISGIDGFEPNNSSSQATLLNLGASVQARIHSAFDVDWFKVRVPTGGTLSFNLSVPAANDYDLELYGPDATLVKGSYQSTSLNESIAYNATDIGTYSVRVYGYPIGNGSFNISTPYSLSANFSTASGYPLIVTALNGTVAKNPDQGSYVSGRQVALTATPANGFQFAGWTGDAVGNGNQITVTMDRSKAVIANFTIASVAPTIVTHPHNESAAVGSAAVFTLVASGTAPLSYQWRKNASDIPDATSSTLTLNNVSSSDAGPYNVRVSNSRGAIVSYFATLTVNVGGALRVTQG